MLLATSSTRLERHASPALRGTPLRSPALRIVLAHRRHRFCTLFGTRASLLPPARQHGPPHPHSALHHSAPAWPETLATPDWQGLFSGSAPSISPLQASPVPFGHPSRLTDVANAAATSREQAQQAALVLSPGSPAALDDSLQPLGLSTAAVEAVSRSRRRSGPAAALSPAPHSSPHVQPFTDATAEPQPSARAAPAVVPPQPSEQARPHAFLPSLDSSSATECAAASILPAGAAASSTPAPGPATHPIALSREEYHARYAATHPTRRQKCGKTPTPATSQA